MKRLHKIQDKEQIPFLFSSFLKKPLSILVIFCFLIFSSGCTDVDGSGNEAELVEVAKGINNSDSEAGLIEVTDLSQIDEALIKGPVMLKLGSKGCIPCEMQEEVFSELFPIYEDEVSIMLIDLKKHPEFAATFGVRSIPDTCIITGIEDGKYMYMRPDGSKSSERASARFLGVADKYILSETLDKAIESRNTGE